MIGVEAAELERLLADEEYLVEPECWEAVQAFVYRLSTVWRETWTMGGLLIEGLRWEAAMPILQALRFDTPLDELVTQLQIMEQCAVPVLNEQIQARRE